MANRQRSRNKPATRSNELVALTESKSAGRKAKSPPPAEVNARRLNLAVGPALVGIETEAARGNAL
jgi:hypothetical protein